MAGTDQLLAVARTYAEATGLGLSVVSWRSLEDSKRLGQIEEGAGITVSRLERALQWFSDNWPDVDWPADVPRPSVSARESSEVRA